MSDTHRSTPSWNKTLCNQWLFSAISMGSIEARESQRPKATKCKINNNKITSNTTDKCVRIFYISVIHINFSCDLISTKVLKESRSKQSLSKKACSNLVFFFFSVAYECLHDHCSPTLITPWSEYAKFLVALGLVKGRQVDKKIRLYCHCKLYHVTLKVFQKTNSKKHK